MTNHRFAIQRIRTSIDGSIEFDFIYYLSYFCNERNTGTSQRVDHYPKLIDTLWDIMGNTSHGEPSRYLVLLVTNLGVFHVRSVSKNELLTYFFQ